jgi:hypothetical protein
MSNWELSEQEWNALDQMRFATMEAALFRKRPSKCRGLRSQSSVFHWKIWIPATESGR